MVGGNDNKNSKDPHISVASFNAVIWVEFVIALSAVLFRVWIRVKKATGLQLDDYWVFLALACLFVMSVLQTTVLPTVYMLLEILHGTWTQPLPADFYSVTTKYLRLQFALIVLFWSCLWAVKGAFLAFYKTLFDNGFLGWQKVAWWIVAVFCFVSYAGNWPLQFLACTPFNDYFTIGKCETPRDLKISNASLYYSTAVDIFCDVLSMYDAVVITMERANQSSDTVIALPLTLLPKLRLNTKKKIALAVLFATGFIIIVFSVIRLAFTKPDKSHVNPKWLGLMSSTEASIAVIASCAPAFRKLFTQPPGYSNKSSQRTPIMLPSNNSRPSQKSEVAGFGGNPLDLKTALSMDGAMRSPQKRSPDQDLFDEEPTHDDTWRRSDFSAGHETVVRRPQTADKSYRRSKRNDQEEDYESGYQ
ncbi:MAG: hypothetical protein M1828_001910 [Chrysothrix sp. TS-e1954]|nr:MAG: hypothetical protein M1828_001910 [Chrysothrix sp. TS-e1954]